MVGSSKILTVSYGTFSCTLEGFDDSFHSMKAIAEYFRDLAQDDRYFGAEPPTPDAEMLARIAEREISRRVEAQMDNGGIRLTAAPQADDADVTMPPAAQAPTAEAATPDSFVPAGPTIASAFAETADLADAPEAPAPAAPLSSDASSVAAKLQRIRAVVGNDSAPTEDAFEDATSSAFVATPDADEAEVDEETLEASAVEVEDDSAEDEAVAETAEAEVEIEETEAVEVVEADTDDAPVSEQDDTFEVEADVEANDETSSDADVVEEVTAGSDDVEDDSADIDDVQPTLNADPLDDPLAAEVEDGPVHDDEALDALYAALAQDTDAPAETAEEDMSSDLSDTDDLSSDLNDIDEDLSSNLNDIDVPQEDVTAEENTEAPRTTARARIVRMRKDGPAEVISADDETANAAVRIAPIVAPVAAAEDEAEVDADIEVEATHDDVSDDDTPADVAEADADTPFDLAEALNARTDDDVSFEDMVAEEAEVSEDDAHDDESIADVISESDQLDAIAAQLAAQSDLRDIEAEITETEEVAEIDNEAASEAEDTVEEVVVEASVPAVAEAEETGHDDIRAAIAEAMPAGSLSAEDEDDLQRELAAVAEEVVVLEEETPAPQQFTIADVVAEVEAKVEAGGPDLPEVVEAPKSRKILPEPDRNVSRIIAQTDEELNEPAGSRRRNAIAQLKAAVAATEAARQLGDNSNNEAAAQNAFRQDLDDVVRPSRPIIPNSEEVAEDKPRAAPLKLVASQRVDEDEAEETKVTPSRPVSAAATTDAGGFAQFAASMGATELPDLLEAAAAYTAFVEGVQDFSRPQIMKKVQMTTTDEFSREDGLRSFGTLLRQGRISKVRNGRFQVSEQTRFRPDARSA